MNEKQAEKTFKTLECRLVNVFFLLLIRSSILLQFIYFFFFKLNNDVVVSALTMMQQVQKNIEFRIHLTAAVMAEQKYECIWQEKHFSSSFEPKILFHTLNFRSSINSIHPGLQARARTSVHVPHFYHLFIFTLKLDANKWIFIENLFFIAVLLCFHHKVYDVNKFVAHVACSTLGRH